MNHIGPSTDPHAVTQMIRGNTINIANTEEHNGLAFSICTDLNSPWQTMNIPTNGDAIMMHTNVIMYVTTAKGNTRHDCIKILAGAFWRYSESGTASH
jgi:hypothetical protein